MFVCVLLAAALLILWEKVLFSQRNTFEVLFNKCHRKKVNLFDTLLPNTPKSTVKANPNLAYYGTHSGLHALVLGLMYSVLGKPSTIPGNLF